MATTPTAERDSSSDDTPGETPAWVDRKAEPWRTSYVAMLHRAPFATDAYHLGFATGVREDYALRDHVFRTVDLPVWMLDNDFRDPDLDRYLDVLDAQDPTPRVGVIGDAYDRAEAREFVDVARDLRDRVAAFEPIIVPKDRGALRECPPWLLVGYPLGYSDVDPEDVAPRSVWRATDAGESRRLHILGGTPPTAWSAIRQLTDAPDPTIQGLEQWGVSPGHDATPADVVGLDWNGLIQVAYVGEHWYHRAPHWRRADHREIRDTVRAGLESVVRYWRERRVWPRETPRDRLGSPVEAADPEDAWWVCARCGSDLACLEEVHDCFEYRDAGVLAFCSSSCRKFVEYREGLTRVGP